MLYTTGSIFENLIKSETKNSLNELFGKNYDGSEAMHGLYSLAETQLGEVNYKRVEADYDLECLKTEIKMMQERIKFEGAEPVLLEHVELEDKKIGKMSSHTVFFVIMQVFSIMNTRHFRPRMSVGDKNVVAEYIEWKDKIYFISDEIYPTPYITDATFAFAVKIGVLVELNSEYKETVKDLFKNPKPYLKKMAAYMEENPNWKFAVGDVVNMIMT